MHYYEELAILLMDVQLDQSYLLKRYMQNMADKSLRKRVRNKTIIIINANQKCALRDIEIPT